MNPNPTSFFRFGLVGFRRMTYLFPPLLIVKTMLKKEKSLSQNKKTNRKPCKEEENPQTSNTISAMAKSTHFAIPGDITAEKAKATFPEDVVKNILVRLPVKTLLRFKSVSKPWRSLINSNYFIKCHLQLSTETQSDLHLILEYSDLWDLEFDSLHKAVRLDCPFKSEENGTRVFGSCNGLLCISKSQFDVALWNPLTRAIFVLPSSPFEAHPDMLIYMFSTVHYGFGYDPVTDDYKILRLTLPKGEVIGTFHCEVKLFSLKSNSWKKIADVPIYVSMLNDPIHSYTAGSGLCVDGALYWALNPKKHSPNHRSIIAFDFRDERFHDNIVHCPEFGHDDFRINAVVLDGKFCIVCNHSRVKADIWVMTKHRANESWTKLFTVVQEYPEILSPLAYSRSRDKVLFEQNAERLVWYDMKSGSLAKVKFRGGPRSFVVNVCEGSLVSPNVGNGSDGTKQNTDKEKMKKNRKKRDDFLSEGFKLKL